MKRTAAERFWPKVDKHGPIPERHPELGSCWLWTRSTAGAGYGWFWDGEKPTYAHRWALEDANGPLPEGLEPDHLCDNPPCVKALADEHGPAHIRATTHRVNVLRSRSVSGINARKTHCPRGHPYDLATTQGRWCSICQRASADAYNERRRKGNAPSSRTHCPAGHLYDEANTYLWRGKRQCKTCRTRRDRSR